MIGSVTIPLKSTSWLLEVCKNTYLVQRNENKKSCLSFKINRQIRFKFKPLWLRAHCALKPARPAQERRLASRALSCGTPRPRISLRKTPRELELMFNGRAAWWKHVTNYSKRPILLVLVISGFLCYVCEI